MSLPPEQPHHERRSPSSSGEMNYKGVRQRKSGSWVSEVRLPNSRERIWLGSYDTPEKAARAFDAASLCLRGPGGADGLNFPSSPPAVRRRTSDRKEVLAAALSHANQSAATESLSANGGAPMERVPTTLPPAEPKVSSPEAESTDDWSQLLPPMPSAPRRSEWGAIPTSCRCRQRLHRRKTSTRRRTVSRAMDFGALVSGESCLRH